MPSHTNIAAAAAARDLGVGTGSATTDDSLIGPRRIQWIPRMCLEPRIKSLRGKYSRDSVQSGTVRGIKGSPRPRRT